MGRIKSLMIKKAARELHEQVPDFTENFDHNRKILSGSIHYKSMRNKVAGGIVNLVKKQKQKELAKSKKVSSEEVVGENLQQF